MIYIKMESQVESQTVPTCDEKCSRKNFKVRILVMIVAAVLLLAASVFTYKMTMGSQTASSKAVKVVQSNQKQDTGNKNDVTGTSVAVDKSLENPSNGSDNGVTQPSNNGTTSGVVTPKDPKGTTTKTTSGTVSPKNTKGTTTDNTSGNVTQNGTNGTTTNIASSVVSPTNTNKGTTTNTTSGNVTPGSANGTVTNTTSDNVTPGSANGTVTNSTTDVLNPNGNTGQITNTNSGGDNSEQEEKKDAMTLAEHLQRIYFPRHERSKEEFFPTYEGELWSIAVDGSDLRCHIDKSPQFGTIKNIFSSRKRPLVYFLSKGTIYVLDLTKKGSKPQSILDEVGCFDVNIDENQIIAIMQVTSSSQKLSVYNILNDELVISEEAPKRENKRSEFFNDIHFDTDDKYFYYVDSFYCDKVNKLFVKLKRAETLGNEETVIMQFEDSDNIYSISPNAEKLVFVRISDSKYKLMLVNLKRDSVQTEELQTLNNNFDHIFWSQDSQYIYFSAPFDGENDYKLHIYDFNKKENQLELVKDPSTGDTITTTEIVVDDKRIDNTSGGNNGQITDNTSGGDNTEPEVNNDAMTLEEHLQRIYFPRYKDSSVGSLQTHKGELWSMANDGSDLRCHFDDSSNLKDIKNVISSRKKPFVYFLSNRTIYVLDLTEKNPQPQKLLGEAVNSFSLNKDDSQMIVNSISFTRLSVYNILNDKTVELSKETPERLKQYTNRFYASHFEESGKSFYYIDWNIDDTDNTVKTIKRADITGNVEDAEIMKLEKYDSDFCFSPNAEKLVFLRSTTDANYKLMLINLKGNTAKIEDLQILKNTCSDFVWSHDSQKFYFSMQVDDEKDFKLHVYDLNNKENPLKIVRCPPNWEPILTTGIVAEPESTDETSENKSAPEGDIKDKDLEPKKDQASGQNDNTLVKERIYFSSLYDINWGKIFSVAADGTDYKCHAEKLSSKEMYIRAVSKTDPATVIYSTNNKLFSLNLLDNTSKILDDGNSKYYASFSPDQKYLAYVNDNNHILKVIKTESGENVFVKLVHKDIKDMTFTHDGKHILILAGENNEIIKMDAVYGFNSIKVATIGSGYAGRALCPDGKTFVGIKDNKTLFVSRYENETVTPLHNNGFEKGSAEILSWSQDNTKVYISLDLGKDSNLYEYSIAENTLKQIKNESNEPVSLA